MIDEVVVRSCDWPDCDVRTQGTRREVDAREGWYYANGRDYCPGDHARDGRAHWLELVAERERAR